MADGIEPGTRCRDPDGSTPVVYVAESVAEGVAKAGLEIASAAGELSIDGALKAIRGR
jgi:hypothetical protein